MKNKYHIITYGCQMNISDSERISGILEQTGLIKSENINSVDLIIVNICSVRQSAVNRAISKIEQLTKLKNKNIIAAGCILIKDRIRLNDMVDTVISAKDINNLPDILKSLGIKTKDVESPKDYLKITPQYQTEIIGYVPIMTGCNNFCSYCVVPYLRDKEISRPAKDIITEVKTLIKQNKKEIWLLGQNVNSYKYRNYSFAKLLKEVDAIKGDFWIRFTSSHPKDLSKDLIKTFSKCQKVTPYLNLPIQSGDNQVLKAMNRPYTIKHYKDLIKQLDIAFNKNRSGLEKILSLSTDVIVGFPKETNQQFKNTLKTFKEINFSNAFISCYSPRPQTTAFKLKDDISNCEKKKREQILTKVVQNNSLKFNKQFLNKIVDVLILERHKDFFIGKTRHYQTIKIKSSADILGQFIKARVIKAMHFGLEGDIALPKIIVIAGPTASGKSDLAVYLAKKFNGEIISADSRQAYKGMDIGTGKITKKEMQGIPHHLLDVISPKKRFDVSQYQKLANKVIKDILKRNKLPIICGGTGFYIQSIIDGLTLPSIKPDLRLRKQLEKKSLKDLFLMLRKKDPHRAKNIDQFNKRRLIRALEIVLKSKKPIPILKTQNRFDVLFLGVKKDKSELKQRIHKRLLKRFRQGMIKEIENLKKSGLSWKKLEDFGLEYRFISFYLQKKIPYQQMVQLLQIASEQYSKRQMTWFKKDRRIIWIKNKKEALTSAKSFI